ncbi:hypothetical protein ARMGADRAFT_1085663 [Armillaria gallica]|uniref:Uncharacterized protein n=1 Tax=Armillaria gallica TaxID=47427 RepID=A0A2H3DDS7_ARMGA|nr:hypothetical protein ARMGADRAFT_1085663 [Armillaria gallica]
MSKTDPRFVRAYNTLADGGSHLPKEAMDILAGLQAEVDAVSTALTNHQGPTLSFPNGIPAYLGLAQINWDYFGADACTAYNTGHATAIQKAISGDLDGADAMNVFADLFLEDSFSASQLLDACARHDWDNTIKMGAKNSAGQSRTLYGGSVPLDFVNEDDKTRCVYSVQVSVDEIYKVYPTKQAPSPTDRWFWSTALECKTSGWWNYPTTINGLQNIIP